MQCSHLQLSLKVLPQEKLLSVKHLKSRWILLATTGKLKDFRILCWVKGVRMGSVVFFCWVFYDSGSLGSFLRKSVQSVLALCVVAFCLFHSGCNIVACVLLPAAWSLLTRNIMPLKNSKYIPNMFFSRPVFAGLPLPSVTVKLKESCLIWSSLSMFQLNTVWVSQAVLKKICQSI